MANVLMMPKVEAMHLLQSEGLSFRVIAKRLAINRETVSRLWRLASGPISKPASAPIFPARAEEPVAGHGAAIGVEVAGCEPPTGLPGSQVSAASPWLAWLLEQRAKGLSSKRIHQDLLAEFPAAAVSYGRVRRLLKKQGAHKPVPFQRMESRPAPRLRSTSGLVRRSSAPTASGGKYTSCESYFCTPAEGIAKRSSLSPPMTSSGALRTPASILEACHETLVIDNLKAGGLKADWYDPKLNSKFTDFCRHYGTVALPTKPRTPRHKGKVERGVGYVQDNALKRRSSTTLEEQNEFLIEWEGETADRRINGTTKRRVLAVFSETEQAPLLPLPGSRFENFHEAKRRVSSDGHIEVAEAFFSVPLEYLGRFVWARWNGRTVRVLNDRMASIAIHSQQGPGRFQTAYRHVSATKINNLERGIAYLFGKTLSIGTQAHAWAEAVVASRGIEGHRVAQGLLALTHKHTAKDIGKACETALAGEDYPLAAVRQVISRRAEKQQSFEFVAEHPIIRPLDDYAAVVAQAIYRRQSRPSMGEGFGSHDTDIHSRIKDRRPTGALVEISLV